MEIPTDSVLVLMVIRAIRTGPFGILVHRTWCR
jgi:hypothetical protein